jgi:hypothetical protein
MSSWQQVNDSTTPARGAMAQLKFEIALMHSEFILNNIDCQDAQTHLYLQCHSPTCFSRKLK